MDVGPSERGHHTAGRQKSNRHPSHCSRLLQECLATFVAKASNEASAAVQKAFSARALRRLTTPKLSPVPWAAFPDLPNVKFRGAVRLGGFGLPRGSLGEVCGVCISEPVGAAVSSPGSLAAASCRGGESLSKGKRASGQAGKRASLVFSLFSRFPLQGLGWGGQGGPNGGLLAGERRKPQSRAKPRKAVFDLHGGPAAKRHCAGFAGGSSAGGTVQGHKGKQRCQTDVRQANVSELRTGLEARETRKCLGELVSMPGLADDLHRAQPRCSPGEPHFGLRGEWTCRQALVHMFQEAIDFT